MSLDLAPTYVIVFSVWPEEAALHMVKLFEIMAAIAINMHNNVS